MRRWRAIAKQEFLREGQVMRTGYSIAVGLVAGIAALAAPAQAAEFTLKIGVAGAEDTEHNMAKALKEVVERISNNRIEVQIFPRNTLGSQSAIIQRMQFGTIG